LTLAGKIDAILKLSVVASVLLASSSVGYYYLVHLPHQDAQFEPERVLERLRAAAKKRAEQEQLLFEEQASEQRAAEQQRVEERQTLEKANRYQACLSRATDNYNASRLAACNRAREKIINLYRSRDPSCPSLLIILAKYSDLRRGVVRVAR
jgi:hypothetical protein